MVLGLQYDENTKIISMPERDGIEIPEGGLGYLLFERMRKNSDKVAQIDALTGKLDNYSSYLTRCVRTAIEMKNKGVEPGDVVCISSINHLNSAVPFIAAIFIGAKIASLDPSLSLEDHKQLLNIAKPKLLFVSANVEQLCEDIKPNCPIVVFGETDRNIRFDKFIQEKEAEDKFKPLWIEDNTDTVVIIFSSGTTGLPKGICMSHRFLIFSCTYRLHSIALGFATLYWMSSVHTTVSSIINGTSRLIVAGFDAKLTWQYLKQYKVDLVIFAPCDAITFYRNKPDSYELPNLSIVIIGGSTMSNDYIQKFRDMLPTSTILYMYGQTELFGVFNGLNPNAYKKVGCVGVPLPGRNFKIVDQDTGKAVGFNQTGELRVKTQWCMNGYYNIDSSSLWDEEGFLKTGDIAHYDEDFCFFIDDRIKEMFKYKSWHIVPAKLESILMAHPDVYLAAVIGVPHPEEDNHIMAFVQPTEGHKATAEDICKFVDEQMDDRHKLRAGVRFIKSMPLTPTGKIKRRELRDMYLKGKLQD